MLLPTRFGIRFLLREEEEAELSGLRRWATERRACSASSSACNARAMTVCSTSLVL